MISQNFVKNNGLIIPPKGSNPAIKETSNVVTGSLRGFILLSLDFSFRITGDVHTVVIPISTIRRQAEINEKHENIL